MARWGEGDPRWIVEERPDATNVNNWHWTEKNASEWSKAKLKELLTGLEVKTAEGYCKILEEKKLEGEASANNRKGKLIFFYEFEIEFKWEGYLLSAEDEKFEGTLEIPNLSDENSADSIDVNVSVESTREAAYQLKEQMRLKGTPLIRERLAIFIKELKDEYGKNLILPTKGMNLNTAPVTAPKAGSTKPIQKEVLLGYFYNQVTPVVINADKLKDVNVGVRIQTKSLKLVEHFKCTAHELYSAFVTPEMVQAFTRAPCQVEAKPGGKFVLYNGVVDGQFNELTFCEKLSMSWRMNSWPSGHYSDVLIKFVQTDDDTELHLDQNQIPESHFDLTSDGWKRHYFEAIKHTFGFGAKLF